MARAPVARTCPHCCKAFRLGAIMPPLKAAIIDVIKAAGGVGISSQELLTAIERPAGPGAVKSHVFQINELLDGTGFRVVSIGQRWHLTRRAKDQCT
jgi:hypothetical protein